MFVKEIVMCLEHTTVYEAGRDCYFSEEGSVSWKTTKAL